MAHGAAAEPIFVSASTEGDSFVFSVSNGGEPIDESSRARLFQPFFRGASQQGLGLGLYIAAEIARAHGGTLDVDSNAKATSFTFTVPLG